MTIFKRLTRCAWAFEIAQWLGESGLAVGDVAFRNIRGCLDSRDVLHREAFSSKAFCPSAAECGVEGAGPCAKLLLRRSAAAELNLAIAMRRSDDGRLPAVS